MTICIECRYYDSENEYEAFCQRPFTITVDDLVKNGCKKGIELLVENEKV